MALIDVKVPQLSESVAEATLLQWHKKAGEAVTRDENLIDIETDKVVLELPAPSDGVLAEIRKEDGSTVVAGEVIAILDTDAKAGAAPAPAAQAPAAAAAGPAPAQAAAPAPAAAGATGGPAMPAADASCPPRHPGTRWPRWRPRATRRPRPKCRHSSSRSSCRTIRACPDRRRNRFDCPARHS